MVNCKLVGVWGLEIWFKAKDFSIGEIGESYYTMRRARSINKIRDESSSEIRSIYFQLFCVVEHIDEVPVTEKSREPQSHRA